MLRTVLRFAVRHWARRKGLAAALCASMSLATVTEIFVPVFAGRLIDALALGGAAGRSAALAAFLAIIGLGVAMVVLRHLAWQSVVPFTLSIMRAAASEAFHRVQRLSTDWHANSFSGSLVRKVTRGMWAFDALDDVVLLALLPSLVALFGTVALMASRWPVLGAVMAAGRGRLYRPDRDAGDARCWRRRRGSPTSGTQGSAACSPTRSGPMRWSRRSPARRARTNGSRAVLDKWSRRTRRTWLRFTWSGTGQLALLWTIRAGVTGTALWLWAGGRASAGDVVYVLTAYLVLHGYLRDIGQHVHHLQRAVNEMEELALLHAEPLGVEDAAEAKPIRIDAGAIRFNGVTFRYGGHATPLYSALDVAIPAGQRLGLVGHSGSGKTTFVKLIQRLYDVTGGRITIDGQDIAQATQASLRRQIAIVPQEPVLFHRSLAENIGYARPDASPGEIEAAARLANAHDFIAALPRGYRTLVGERGVKLSGGERQRVALARAFLADAPILILDEATSSLDSESEALIQQAIERLMTGRTAIIIAHRLSTVRGLDRILVFDQGRIVEDGTHAALLARDGGHYRRLFERQSGVARREEEIIG